MNSEASVEVIQGPQGPNISFNGRLLYSGTSTPEKRVESLLSASHTLYIIISPLLFLGVDFLISKIPEDSKILAVEYDSRLYETGIHESYSRFKDKLKYVKLTDGNFSDVIKSVAEYRCRRIIPVKLNMGYMLHRKIYDRFIDSSVSFLQTFWKNRMTTIHMGRLWCRNIFLNMPVLTKASPLSRLHTEKPVICVGAGESLEYSIDFIKSVRKNVFLTAADTAAATLLLNGISPDLVIVLEAQHANLPDFYEQGALGLAVAADISSSPELLRKLYGPLYLFASQFDDARLLDKLSENGFVSDMILPLGSVGIAAVNISSMLTNKEVFYTGLDFSFPPGKYHASGAPSHILGMINGNRTSGSGLYAAAYSSSRFKVADKSGFSVYTDLIMQSYRDTLAEVISRSSRIYDIGVKGISAGKNRLTHTEASVFIQSCQAEEMNGSRTLGHAGHLQIENRKILSFLDSEIKQLDKAIEKVVAFQNGRSGSESLPDELFTLIRELDYTWLFFPDNKPLPCADSSFLKRFLFSAAWFKNHIHNTVSLIEN